MRPIDESQFDIYITAEDAPQIAGIVDERGPVDFGDKRRWKIVADNEDGDLTITSQDKESKRSKKVARNLDDDLTPPRMQKKCLNDDSSPPRTHKSIKKKQSKRNVEENNDLSPPGRKSKKHANSERKTSQSNSDSDSSSEVNVPSSKMKKKAKRRDKEIDSDLSPPRQPKNHDSDSSLPKKSTKHRSQRSKKVQSKSDSDMSPPRRNREDSDSDLSPPRSKKNQNHDSDFSPPRRSRKHEHDKRNSNLNSTKQRKDSDSDSDLSPPRREVKHMEQSKAHKSSNFEQRRDLSPPRQHKYRDSSLHREKKYRRKNRELDRSRSRSKEDNREVNKSKSRWNNKYEYDSKHQSHGESSYRKEKSMKDASNSQRLEMNHDKRDRGNRMKKTLDGKTAGLQDARSLREETEAYKKREAEHFKNLSKEVTGIGQATIVRDTKTGRKRNLEAEAAEEREKQKRQAELNEKYAKWGKGLKQVEDREEKLKDDLYEMSKPLARYADDADLDKTLREQEREGDPMLEYIKQKQIKEGKRKPERPTYEGSFMPNRFGIKPGHLWDGVDRSNGYEKRWFETQNAMVARQEEAYKWSTSDM
ncbi:BUD13 homolog isoform X2 [Colletes gigas]|nr:BUD13 homolog isoform X2 [Colletes gigas]